MPNMDGTGPRGMGPLTGRGLGVCRTYGSGFGCGRGFGFGYGRGLGLCRWYANTGRETLETEKEFLKNRLAAIDEQLRKD